ncbi:hypothetical protein EVAR_79147_1 [Eumeta japonica]|uniref:Uncharacterized protein n=1 Tax=Eumeta variegata TaxID=151549 RepID=A0A4C1UT35_EUMVA|nr:hypothetical protein EVAR_79147_1 [Eumeta japonica]
MLQSRDPQYVVGRECARTVLEMATTVDLCELSERWSPPPIDARNPKGVTDQCAAGLLSRNRTSDGKGVG